MTLDLRAAGITFHHRAKFLDFAPRDAHNARMTDHRLTRKELADEFGVDDPDEIADDLYDDFLAYLADHPEENENQ